jgi:dsDNA-specific endonuclease/ATPase MutS2
MEVFRRELNRAIRDNESEIIFIHGIGNGTLKGELRRALDRDFSWCSQEDASFREYGFGATRVRIPQNKPAFY